MKWLGYYILLAFGLAFCVCGNDLEDAAEADRAAAEKMIQADRSAARKPNASRREDFAVKMKEHFAMLEEQFALDFFGFRPGAGLEDYAKRGISQECAEIYQFEPKKKFMRFKTYCTMSTPITHVIYEIKAEAEMDSQKHVQDEFFSVLSFLGEKYGYKFSVDDLKDRITAWSLVHSDRGAILLTVLCAKQDISGCFLLQLGYRNIKLGAQQKKERDKIMECLHDFAFGVQRKKNNGKNLPAGIADTIQDGPKDGSAR